MARQPDRRATLDFAIRRGLLPYDVRSSPAGEDIKCERSELAKIARRLQGSVRRYVIFVGMQPCAEPMNLASVVDLIFRYVKPRPMSVHLWRECKR
jgi:hypothetical protein